MESQEPPFLTTLDAAREAHVSPETIRHWERTGLLPAIRTTSGQRLFTRENVRAAADARKERRYGR
jgi:DNA-binding transcriptional MerR regulator